MNEQLGPSPEETGQEDLSLSALLHAEAELQKATKEQHKVFLDLDDKITYNAWKDRGRDIPYNRKDPMERIMSDESWKEAKNKLTEAENKIRSFLNEGYDLNDYWELISEEEDLDRDRLRAMDRNPLYYASQERKEIDKRFDEIKQKRASMLKYTEE